MTTTAPDALSQFKALEDRIGRLIRVVTQTRKEKQALLEKLHDAQIHVRELESENRSLRKERKTVRSRVQDMIREIAELERENREAKKESQVV
jgi:chromosome segregation ATPase